MCWADKKMQIWIAVGVIVALAIIIGLAVGLSK
jgi:hypothetical protein